jgi:hypothetical protein
LTKQELMNAGMNEESAMLASGRIVNKAGQSIQEQAMQRRLGMMNEAQEQEPQKIERSQVINGADISNRIQEGVTNSEEVQDRKKMLSLTEQMMNVLAHKIPQEIAKARGNRLQVQR